MRRISRLICVVTVFILCCLLCSCAKVYPKEPENVEEYHEIEYVDGSGAHVVKSVYIMPVIEIKFYEWYMQANMDDMTEWEYGDALCKLQYNQSEGESFGQFTVGNSNTSTHGSIALYYDEELSDDIGGGYLLNITTTIDVSSANIRVNGRTLTKLAISPDGTYIDNGFVTEHDYEHTVIGYAGNTCMFTHHRITVAMKINEYGGVLNTITLTEEGDFTTIKRANLQDTTIRTENILRKVRR